MYLTESNTSTFTPCPAGSYPARLVRLVDLGTQASTFEGKTSHARKVLMTWQILDGETCQDDGKPYSVSKRYTASLHEKAVLRRDLASWRGRDFTPDELRQFDSAVLLGRPCLLSVVHAVKDGRTFANVASVSKLPKGMVCPEPTETILHLSLDQFDGEIFERLTEKLQAQIKNSPEWIALQATRTARPSTGAEPPPWDDIPDDIPY